MFANICKRTMKTDTRECEVRIVFLQTHRALLDHPVQHDNGFGLLLPDHEPEVATRVSEGALLTKQTKQIKQINKTIRIYSIKL